MTGAIGSTRARAGPSRSFRALRPVDILDGHGAEVTAIGLYGPTAISGAEDGQVSRWATVSDGSYQSYA